LGRAQETAAIMALEHQLVVTSNQLLRERFFGRLEGRPWSELNVELKELLAQRELLAAKDRFHYKLFPEIESDEDIVNRLIRFLREVALAHLNQSILVVSHGGIMRALLIHLGYFSYQELPTESISNSGYVVLRSDGTEFFIDKTVGITKKTPTN
jgi:broad specificity phosphatase PhoE